MARGEQRALLVALLLADAIALGVAVGTVLLVRTWSGFGTSASLSALLVGGLALTLVAMAATGLYRLDELFSGHREYSGVVRACTYAAFAGLLLTFLLALDVSRAAFVLSWAYSCLFLSTGRFLFRRGVSRLRRRGLFVRRALIAGADEHAVAIGRRLSQPGSGWQIVGFLDDFQSVGSDVVDGLTVVGDPKAAVELANELGASDVILVPHAVSWEAQRDLVETAATSERPALRLAPGLYHLLAAGTRPMETGGVPLMSIERLRITGLDAGLKAALDYGLSVLALPVVAGTFALAWLSARLSDRGAVLERRRAVGLGREPFDLLVLAPPAADAPTRGRWAWRLRRTLAGGKAGKLPGVLNVLSGSMSLVGPRALPAPNQTAGPAWATTLMLVRPGITGPHAANGAGWSREEQALLDVAYVRGYSFWLDLRLLFASLLRALRRQVALPASYHTTDEPPPTPESAPSYAD